jgi:hypothetical protein
MAKKKVKKSALRDPGLILAGRPILSYVAIMFVIVFAGLGGYVLHGVSSASTPEVQLAMNSGKYCLDDNGNGLGKAGAPNDVDSWPCNGSNAQHWYAYGNNIRVNGQCLDVYRNGKTNGTKVDLFPCNGGANQRWSFGNSGQIQSQSSGKCLDAPGYRAQVQLDIWACNGGQNQTWSFTAYDVSAGGGGSGLSCAGDPNSRNYKSSSLYPGECQDAINQLATKGWNNQNELYCLSSIFNWESAWNPRASNASGAYGIPQALPGSKMSQAGADWATNPNTQIKWVVRDYIPPQYGNPCQAWAHELAVGTY